MFLGNTFCHEDAFVSGRVLESFGGETLELNDPL